MGVRELRAAFNEVANPVGTCAKALMEYEKHEGIEYQVLYFSGNYTDGAPFAIKSDRIMPSGDLIATCRETAERFLQQKRGS